MLERTIELKRQQAEALGYPQCPYDALLDEYEPEELTVNVGKVLAGLREALVPLVAKIQQSGRRPECLRAAPQVSRGRAGAVRARGGRGDRV